MSLSRFRCGRLLCLGEDSGYSSVFPSSVFPSLAKHLHAAVKVYTHGAMRKARAGCDFWSAHAFNEPKD